MKPATAFAERHPWGVLLGALAVWVLLWSACQPLRAQPQTLAARSDEVKAAYLYKFLDYVEWPDAAFASPEQPLIIGVVGADPVHAELRRILVGRTSRGRSVVARKLVPGDAFDGVQLVFVGDAGLARSPWVQRLRDRPLLIVADTPQALDLGAAINFIVIEDRLRFEASVRAAERAGLKLSSRLLSLAQRVVPGT